MARDPFQEFFRMTATAMSGINKQFTPDVGSVVHKSYNQNISAKALMQRRNNGGIASSVDMGIPGLKDKLGS